MGNFWRACADISSTSYWVRQPCQFWTAGTYNIVPHKHNKITGQNLCCVLEKTVYKIPPQKIRISKCERFFFPTLHIWRLQLWVGGKYSRKPLQLTEGIKFALIMTVILTINIVRTVERRGTCVCRQGDTASCPYNVATVTARSQPTGDEYSRFVSDLSCFGKW